MLFVNIDLILELIDYNDSKIRNENKLKYYDLICDTTLEEDIKFSDSKHEEDVLKYLYMLEHTNKPIIGDNIGDMLREKLGLYYEREKHFFTKLFVREYLIEKEDRKDLIVDDEIDTFTLFKDFASDELKNDKQFAEVILQLDGRYIQAMSENIQNNKKLMGLAIKNDLSSDVESFSNCSGKIKRNPTMAILYFKRLKENKQKDFSVDEIYEKIFKQENYKYNDSIFKDNEQSSWIEGIDFLSSLAKVDDKFIDYISSGKISQLADSNNRKVMKKAN